MNQQNIKSVRELDRLTGVSNAFLGNLIKNQDPRSGKPISPTIDTLRQICDGLDYSLKDFLSETGYIERCNNPQSAQTAQTLPDEQDLLKTYRQLTINSKQIVITVAQLELKHVAAVARGDHAPIKILWKERKGKNNSKRIKVYTQTAAAGYGNYLADDADFELVQVPAVPFEAEFGIRIAGNSMEPAINDGDIVFVRRQSRVEVGEIGIFIVDNEAFCKKLIYKNGTYYLHSLNADKKKYPDVPVMTESVYTVGVVLDNFHEEK